MVNYSASYKNNVTQSIVPSVSQFFPYIRHFLLEYENLLREVDCRVSIPFWDWTAFHDVPYKSPVWNNEQGFGDTSDQSTTCVTTGPFRQGEYHVSPEGGGGCIKRQYTKATYPSRTVVDKDILTLPAAQFNTLHRFLQLYCGISVQSLVGGTMFSPNAAEDPVFHLQLSQLDYLFTRWQSFGGGREKIRYANDTSRFLLTNALTVSQMSDSSSLPHGTCVSYSPPILLKNNAPPPSRPFVGPFTDQAAPELQKKNRNDKLVWALVLTKLSSLNFLFIMYSILSRPLKIIANWNFKCNTFNNECPISDGVLSTAHENRRVRMCVTSSTEVLKAIFRSVENALQV